MTIQPYRDLAKKAQELSERATPGPWVHEVFEGLNDVLFSTDTSLPVGINHWTYSLLEPAKEADTKFIAASRELVPTLAATVLKMADALEVIEGSPCDCDCLEDHECGACWIKDQITAILEGEKP